MKLGLRYDLRAPGFGAPANELYAAALEQCAWAERNAFHYVHLAEHHGAEDGYCPSPMILASAIAARTTTLEIHLSALVVTLHDPLRLAEDLTVLDLISNGRVVVIAGIGYRPHEFDWFGVPLKQRGQVFEERLITLRRAWSGKPFEYRGMTVEVTPAPSTPGGPRLEIGGNAPISAKRASRLGLPYRPATEELYELYAQQCVDLGRPPPPPFSRQGPGFLYVTKDPGRAWPQVGPYVLHASNMYARWASERANAKVNGSWRAQESVEELKADPSLWVVTPEELLERVANLRPHDELRFHPLIGGMPPELSWQSLELFASDVLPQLDVTN